MNLLSFLRFYYKFTFACLGLTQWNFQNWSILNTVFYQKMSNDEIARQPQRTFYDLIRPQIIFNFNRRQNSDYIEPPRDPHLVKKV